MVRTVFKAQHRLGAANANVAGAAQLFKLGRFASHGHDKFHCEVDRPGAAKLTRRRRLQWN